MKTFIPFTPEQLKELSDLGTIVTLGQMTVKSQEKELVKSRRKLAKISRLHSQKFNSFKRINRELAKARSGK